MKDLVLSLVLSIAGMVITYCVDMPILLATFSFIMGVSVLLIIARRSM